MTPNPEQRYRELLAGRVKDAANTRFAPPSPCISVCKIDEQSRTCFGCLRTLDEIGAWSNSDDAYKREIWARIGQRLQAPST